MSTQVEEAKPRNLLCRLLEGALEMLESVLGEDFLEAIQEFDLPDSQAPGGIQGGGVSGTGLGVAQSIQDAITWLKEFFEDAEDRLEDFGEAVEKCKLVYDELEHLYQVWNISNLEPNPPAKRLAWILGELVFLAFFHWLHVPGAQKKLPTSYYLFEWLGWAGVESGKSFPELTTAQRFAALGKTFGSSCRKLVRGETEEEVREASMHLFRSFAFILGIVNKQGGLPWLHALYGWDNTDEQLDHVQTQTPLDADDPRALLERALTVIVELGGLDLKLSTLAVPQEHGGPALVFLGSGDGDVEVELSPSWKLKLGARLNGPAVTLPLPHVAGSPPPRVDAVAGDAGWGVSFEARHDPPGGRPTVVGTSGVHVDFGSTVAGLYAAQDRAGFRLDLEQAALVITAPEGEGFLRKILGDQEFRAEFDLGVGWDSQAGWYWAGSAGGLSVTLPWSIPLGIGKVSEITLALANVPEIEADGEDAARLEISARLALSFLGISVGLERIGWSMFMSSGDSNSTGLYAHEGFQMPQGMTLSVDNDPVTGHVALTHDSATDSYLGVGALELPGGYGLEAVALVSRTGGAVLVVGSLVFPGEAPQVGMGFRLTKVGLLVAVNRRFDLEAARRELHTGVLGSLLSPDEPLAQLPRIARDLDLLFPAHDDGVAIGISTQLTWGPQDWIELDLALLYDFSSPHLLSVLGALRVRIPDKEKPQVKLNLDALGVLDLSEGQFSVFAQLYKSKILGLKASGSAAALVRVADDPCLILSLGGFHPSYTPPAAIPKMKRLQLKVPDREHFRFSLQAYAAVVGATGHLGGKAEMYVGVGDWASVEGGLSLDALVCFAPLGFELDAAAWFTVKVAGHTFLSIRAALMVGYEPGCWKYAGSLYVSILWWDWEVPVDQTVELDEPGAQPAELVDVAALLDAALSDPGASGPGGPAGEGVVLFRSEDPLMQPLRSVQVSQREAPLGVVLDRVGTAGIDGARAFSLGLDSLGGESDFTVVDLHEVFPADVYFDRSPEQRLGGSTFVSRIAGLSVEPPGIRAESQGRRVTPVTYEELQLDGDGPELHAQATPDTDSFLRAAERSALVDRRLARVFERRHQTLLEVGS